MSSPPISVSLSLEVKARRSKWHKNVLEHASARQATVDNAEQERSAWRSTWWCETANRVQVDACRLELHKSGGARCECMRRQWWRREKEIELEATWRHATYLEKWHQQVVA